MFDIGFSEIVVIAVVALVVIGPEKLPKTARTLGHLFGRLQRYVGEVKADINREMELDELRKLQQEMKSAASDLTQSVQSAAQSMESGARDLGNDVAGAGNDAAAALAPTPTSETATQMAATESNAAAGVAGSAAPGATGTPHVAIDDRAAFKAMADRAASQDPPRQGALPGFEKI